jgi:hypothetical protein
MERTTHIKELAARFSLIVLAVGFSLLGYFSLWREFNNRLTISGSMQRGVCIAAGIASLAVGKTFLVAALLYWRCHLRNLIAIASCQS